jgi:hypothetical protein
MVTERWDVNAHLFGRLENGTAGWCSDFLAIYINIDHRHRLPRLLSKNIYFYFLTMRLSVT